MKHYIILVFILFAGLLLFNYFIGFPNIQFTIVLVIAFLYFLWGVVHHMVEGDFHPRIMVEYLLIALLAILLLRGAIFR